MKKHLTILLMLLIGSQSILSSQKQNTSFFTPADSFHAPRFYTALGFSAVAYTGFSIGLYHAWYKDYNTGNFHMFNDFGEWRNMDKIGHVYTAYMQAHLCFKGTRWTGLSKRHSMLTGLICGGLFQSTIEVMDGFSDQWGFSVPDIAANFIGLGVFATQQWLWDEQYFQLKVSSIPQSYATTKIVSQNGLTETTLRRRADDLFGSSFAEKFLKDYNSQVYWLSFSPKSFVGANSRWPSWLQISLGYGAGNMFGGYENEWIIEGNQFVLDPEVYPRYSKFYLGFDLDLTKIRVKNPAVKTLFSVFNIFKIPSPALEINTLGQVNFHLFR